MGQSPSVVWFRSDLRVADNPALSAAVQWGGPIIPLFIWAPDEEGDWAPGAASRWWLHQSLARLSDSLKSLGAPLIIRHGGRSSEILEDVVRKSQAVAVFWNRRCEPAVFERDRQVEQRLRKSGCHVEVFPANLLTNPWAVRNKSGKPFQVFTAFWNSCLGSIEPASPLPPQKRLMRVSKLLESASLKALELEPRINWASGLAAAWQPGEAGAKKALRKFCSVNLTEYRAQRDFPANDGTSRFSPHLHFGEISCREVWHMLGSAAQGSGRKAPVWKHNKYVSELGWREFAHYLLCHFPDTTDKPLRSEFEHFPWRKNERLLEAWQRGRTGYPLVDAGMRELWATGWMHNRVRMIAASFLVKELLIPWQTGARWFWDTLVDADLANNTLGWQWTAGCGADAAPFFRIFNPVSHGEKFDPKGEYVRRWVPEVARLPEQWIHKPWQAPVAVLRGAGIDLGRSYPFPIVDHSEARTKAMAAFDRLKMRRLKKNLR